MIQRNFGRESRKVAIAEARLLGFALEALQVFSKLSTQRPVMAETVNRHHDLKWLTANISSSFYDLIFFNYVNSAFALVSQCLFSMRPGAE